MSITNGLTFLAGVGQDSEQTSDVGSMRPADSDTVEQLRRPEVLLAQGTRRVTKLVLFPVRFLFTAKTGLVGTNEAAAEHYLADGQVPSTDLVAAAVTWRSAAPDDAEAEALLRGGMIPLYVHYIDDHIARLNDLGRSGLVGAFAEWRRRIVA